MVLKLLIILAIFLGESCFIVGEMFGPLLIKKLSLPLFVLFESCLLLVGGFLIIYGYIKGLETFGNIWKITVCSITSILIIEPTIALLVYRQLPDYRTLIGFVLGMIGLIITVK